MNPVLLCNVCVFGPVPVVFWFLSGLRQKGVAHKKNGVGSFPQKYLPFFKRTAKIKTLTKTANPYFPEPLPRFFFPTGIRLRTLLGTNRSGSKQGRQVQSACKWKSATTTRAMVKEVMWTSITHVLYLLASLHTSYPDQIRITPVWPRRMNSGSKRTKRLKYF